MRAGRFNTRPIGSLSLTRQVALLSLVPIVLLGLILAHVLEKQIEDRTLADATQSARLIARVGIQPRITPSDLTHGLTAREISELDRELRAPAGTAEVARIKIWNTKDQIIYSDDHSLIGRTLVPSDDLEDALNGKPHEAVVVDPKPHSETAGEVGLGRLVEVYVPLQMSPASAPAGVFEIYLSYRPIAATISRDRTTIALLVAIGLALLWGVLYRIVARASGRLRRQAEENHRLAHYDQLTGLPNRKLFIDGVSRAIERRGADPGAVAVLLVDLDRFSEVNHTLGSVNGDAVLREVAARLGQALGADTLVARLGADEYAVLCPRESGVAGAQLTAEQIHQSLEPPIVIDGVALGLEASIGLAELGERARDPEALLQRADAALAGAHSSWSRVQAYSPESDPFDPERLILLGQVRGALEREELVLFYQPKIDLRTRRITGVEALLRWQHPERGLLGPMQFVPLIEQTALIGPVTHYVIERALRQMVAWRRIGVEIGMSVNLSVRNLLDPQLPEQVAGLLALHRIPAQLLTVEVTESAAMTDPGRAVRALDALRAAGVGVSVDDFGTGNATIEYLATLPATELKIDRSFVTDLQQDSRAEAIVRSTIDLARNLQLSVVAEGIETAAVLEHLAELGCDTAQGFFISRPLPAEELLAQLMDAFGVGGAQLGRGARKPGEQSARSLS